MTWQVANFAIPVGYGLGQIGFKGAAPGTAGIALVSAGAAANPAFGTTLVVGGGTGIVTYAVGDLLYASAATTLDKLAAVAIGRVLVSGGITTAPAYSATPQLGASGTLGTLTFGNATSGLITVSPIAGALGTVTLSLPAETGTLVTGATVKTLTNTTFNTTGTGNVFQISGAQFSTLGNGLVIASTVLNKQETINAQTGTTYTVLSSDLAKLVTFNNAGAQAVTLPQATGAFGAGFYFDTASLGAGTVTITPTTSTIDGAANLTLSLADGIRIVSDGTNYFTIRGRASGAAGSVTSFIGRTGAIIAVAGDYNTNKITGTANGADTTAGMLSQFEDDTRAVASATPLTTATAKTVVTQNLTAGIWDVQLVLEFIPTGTTVIAALNASISQTTNTRSTVIGEYANEGYPSSYAPQDNIVVVSPVVRVSLAGTADVFGVAFQSFSVSTLTAAGYLRCRRV